MCFPFTSAAVVKLCCSRGHLRLRTNSSSMCAAVNKAAAQVHCASIQGVYLGGSCNAQSKTNRQATTIICSVQVLANKRFER